MVIKKSIQTLGLGYMILDRFLAPMAVQATTQDQAPPPPIENEKRPSPISVPIKGDEGQAYTDNLEKQLADGETPQFLIESNRLVTEGDSPEADLVIQYIRQILNRLSNATMGKDSPELLIYLSDQNGSNTAVIPQAKTPILIVGLDLIDLLHKKDFAEDHLAAVLGHERFHLLRHKK